LGVKLKFLTILAKWLFILCLPLLLLTASIAGEVNSKWLYQYGFEQYNVSQTTGLAESELEKAADGLIEYFNSHEEYISLVVIKDGQSFQLFNQREVGHLKDVKELFWMDYWVLLGTLVYSSGYGTIYIFWRKEGRKLARALVGGSILTLALMLVMGLGTLLSFDRLFLQFHLISFTNDLWLLDPAQDYLIMLFPSGFWYDATLFCALSTVTGAVILGGVGILYLIKRRSP
jgi:integral membrane protein (TIGR01906 family)